MRLLPVLLLVACASACCDTSVVEVTVIRVEEAGASFQTHSRYRSVLKSEDGFIDEKYGYYGEPGDTFRAEWSCNCLDPNMNGLR